MTTSFPGSSLYLQRKDPGCGWSRDLGDKPKPQGGLLLDKILSTVQHILCRGGINVERDFLSCVQSALLSTGYYSIILKVKQVICLESLFLKKDLVAVLSTGYGKSLFFQVLPRMLSERDSRSMSLFYLELSVFAVSIVVVQGVRFVFP